MFVKLIFFVDKEVMQKLEKLKKNLFNFIQLIEGYRIFLLIFYFGQKIELIRVKLFDSNLVE